MCHGAVIVVSRAQPGVKGTRWGVRWAVAVGDLAKCRSEQIKGNVTGIWTLHYGRCVCFCWHDFFFFFFEGGGSSLIQEIVYRLDLKIRVLRFGYCFTRGLWKNNE